MIYVASPYSHVDPEVQKERLHKVSRFTGFFIRASGEAIFSPIAHGCMIAEHCPDLPHDFAFWQFQCVAMLQQARAVYVLQLPGWNESQGVRHEIDLATKRNLPIHYFPDIVYP